MNSAFSIGTLTKITNDVTIYSEYYPNPKSKFSGTIIFENGAGTDLTEWKQNPAFINCAKQAGSIFLYDRNSLGNSPLDPNLSNTNPQTGKFVSDKLFKLLKKNKVKSPYIFVAHSYGGMYAGYFVLKHPDLVKGFIMVDPVPKNFTFTNKVIISHKVGMEDAKTHSSDFIYKKYRADTETIYELLGLDTAKKEVADLGEINNNIPIIIISSIKMENEIKPINEDWFNSQKQWLNTNQRSKIFTVNTGHFIQQEQPEVVCNQIRSLIDKN